MDHKVQLEKKSRSAKRDNRFFSKNPLNVVTQELHVLPKEGSYLVGVSGGSDSVALLHLLLEGGYRHLLVCHFNHELRGEDSHDDALFVKNLALRLDLPFVSGSESVCARAKTSKISIETAAREARYEFFAQISAEHSLSTLLLGHHADDQIETCFFNFLRGTGSKGLAGMLPYHERLIGGRPLMIVRPLLSLSKKRIMQYLQERSISYCHDKSNDSLIPTRNRLRHELFPLLDKLIGASYREAILRAARILAIEDQYLESVAAPLAKNPSLSIEEIDTLPLALARRVIHAWLKEQGFSEVGFAEVEKVASLLHPQSAHQINLPGDRHAYRSRGHIHIKANIFDLKS